jgi:phosphoglycerate dehydrogenase-like enzyme
LQPELVQRIRAVDPARLRVIHEPSLVPSGPYSGGYLGSKPSLDEDGKARWRSILADADILFEFDWLEPARLPENAPRLRWLQASKSGIGEFLRRLELDRSGITFCTAAGVHAVPLAEWVVFGLLWLVKDLWRVLDQQERHHWEQFEAGVLRGRRVLLIGLGGVGREIARLLDAHGVEVWGVRRSTAETPDHVRRLVPFDGIDAALGEVDAVVLACPYTAETHHLLNADRLARLRRGAYVLNVARGAVIDEAALIHALRSGHVGGAVLDVQEREPMAPGEPLWDAPNVLISPHRASIVPVENALVVDLFIDNLRRDLAGQPLRNVYDPAREY